MRTKIIVQFESSLRKEFLKNLVETSFPNINIKEYDLWEVPYYFLPSDMSVKNPVWNLSVEYDDSFDVQSLLNVIKGIKEIEKGNDLATLLNSVEPSNCVADRKKTKVEDKICGFNKKNMNKGIVRIGFGLTNNGYWSCEQVKAKILEYISDTTGTDAEINVTYPNNEFDNDFSIDISVDKDRADRLNFAEFMEWCESNIVGSRPLIHGFRSESNDDGYKITFETTSVEEYDLVESFIRKTINRYGKIMMFHCKCGYDFVVNESSAVKMGLHYTMNCPACHAICKKPIEEV